MKDRVRIIDSVNICKDNRHILVCGLSGSGKTNFMERLALRDYETGKYKVIFFDLFKYECCQFGFKNEGEEARILKREHGVEPRGYPHEVLIPFARTRLEKSGDGNLMQIELPSDSKEFIAEQKKKGLDGEFSSWKAYKWFFGDLSAEDMQVMLAGLTEPGRLAMDFLYNFKKFESLDDLIKHVIRLASKENLTVSIQEGEAKVDTSSEASIGKKIVYQSVLNNLIRIKQTGFFCDKGNEHSLDLDAILRDQKTVTTFTFANLDNVFLQYMAIVAIWRKIMDLRVENRDKYPELLMVIPELADFAPSSANISISATIGAFSARTAMQTYSRHSRVLGVKLICDTQTPSDVDRTVLTNFGWFIIFASQKQTIRFINQNFVRIPDIPYTKIPNLETGRCCVLRMDSKDFHYPWFAQPNRAKHKSRSDNVRAWVAEHVVKRGGGMRAFEDRVYSKVSISISEKNEGRGKENHKAMIVGKIMEMAKSGDSLRSIAKALDLDKEKARRWYNEEIALQEVRAR